MKYIHSTMRGFVSIVALFLLVVMAALGGFMLTFSNTHQLTSAQDFKGSQAYWAARAGLEWGMGNVIRQPSKTADCSYFTEALPGSGEDFTRELTGPDEVFTQELTGFDGGFTVDVACIQSVYTEGVIEKKIFSLTSVASNVPATPGNVGFIERSVSASIEK